ncbi:MAG: aminoglycoside phosphotransferase, partial [Paenibacillaceae bacterium]|nr:aminoglycoside phosphotransferase [Paenibacillaceae bacterium]
ELSYRIKCLEDDIPYLGFFHDIYSCEAPFEYEERPLT